MPRSLPVEWVAAECAGELGDRFHFAAQADADVLAGIDRGVVFVFHNSGTPRLVLRRLVALVAAEDPDGRLSFTLYPVAGAHRLLSRPEFAGVNHGYGLIVWVRQGNVVSFTTVIGVADAVLLENTRELLAAAA